MKMGVKGYAATAIAKLGCRPAVKERQGKRRWERGRAKIGGHAWTGGHAESVVGYVGSVGERRHGRAETVVGYTANAEERQWDHTRSCLMGAKTCGHEERAANSAMWNNNARVSYVNVLKTGSRARLGLWTTRKAQIIEAVGLDDDLQVLNEKSDGETGRRANRAWALVNA